MRSWETIGKLVNNNNNNNIGYSKYKLLGEYIRFEKKKKKE